MAKSALAGLKILVTRSRDQAWVLAQGIEQAGGSPLLFPLLDIAPRQDQQALIAQVAHLADADLAIFISPNAVQYGMAAIRAAGCSLPASLAIATVGQGSAKALFEQGVRDVLVPEHRYDSEGLLALPQLQQIAGKQVMIFRGEDGRALLGDTLKLRGAQVEYVACYSRSKPVNDVGVLTNELPDAITVTSSEALGHLWQMLPVRLRGTPIFATHPRIADLAREQGWQHVYQTDAGDDGLLAGLLEWAANRTQDAGFRKR